MFVGWVNPHVPYGTTKEYYDRIDPAKIPARVRIEDATGKSLMVERLLDYSNMREFPEKGFEELRRVYLSQCALIDDQVKAVVEALKEEDMYDDSAIFFLSDHGDWAGDFNLPEKAQNCFEDCLTRVPLIIKPPKSQKVDPGTTNALTELVDFYATVLDYAGVEPMHDHFGAPCRGGSQKEEPGLRVFRGRSQGYGVAGGRIHARRPGRSGCQGGLLGKKACAEGRYRSRESNDDIRSKI
jgi:arylsulfatase A-like enzyme